VRRRDKEERLRRMGEERSFPDPHVRDRLSDEESEPGGGEAGEAGDLPAVRGVSRPIESQRTNVASTKSGTAQKVTKSSTSSPMSG
jgi:hypothetical protein